MEEGMMKNVFVDWACETVRGKRKPDLFQKYSVEKKNVSSEAGVVAKAPAEKV